MTECFLITLSQNTMLIKILKKSFARRMEDKFCLPGFALGIDGMFVRFDGAVRSIPVGEGLPVLQGQWS